MFPDSCAKDAFRLTYVCGWAVVTLDPVDCSRFILGQYLVFGVDQLASDSVYMIV